MAVPNLFILGAAKCGTTTLYHLLKRHPDIKVCDPKEPSFFCSQFQVVKNPVDYFSLFNSERRYRADASHVYFSNPETPPILRDLFPKARFLLILRDPKARAHSLYQHMRRSLHEDGRPMELVETFHEALLREEERFNAPGYRAACRQYFWNFMYMRSSCYDVQLARYLALFPRESFLILSLACLHRQPKETVEAIARFLDVDPAGFGEDVPAANVAPLHGAIDPACSALMEAHFTDLTNRVDRLAGELIDWSL